MCDCPGNGECLEQVSLTKLKKSANTLCNHHCQPVFCPNQKICQAGELQKWFLDCHGALCINCRVGLWPLVFAENLECPICLEIGECVQQGNCEHFVCIDCFRRCQYGDENCIGEPPFPYSKEIQEKYDNDEELGEEVDWAVIEKWNADWIRWDDEREATVTSIELG